MRAALSRAGFEPGQIEAVNAHATATPVGDVVEARALREVFGRGIDHLPVSATKSVTGHLLGAAGGLEAVLSISAIQARLLPPTMNLETAGPGCELDHVAGKARPAQVAHILSNSFGFGGTNGSVIFSHPEA
jgi:3-oxoacyl-[acyl-carrier-protein] synthase II